MSEGEFAMSEFWDLECGVVGMIYLLLLCLLLVVVCGDAGIIRCAHVDVPGMFTGAAAIWGHTTGPAHAITGGGSIRVLQGFVFDVGVGV